MTSIDSAPTVQHGPHRAVHGDPGGDRQQVVPGGDARGLVRVPVCRAEVGGAAADRHGQQVGDGVGGDRFTRQREYFRGNALSLLRPVVPEAQPGLDSVQQHVVLDPGDIGQQVGIGLGADHGGLPQDRLGGGREPGDPALQDFACPGRHLGGGRERTLRVKQAGGLLDQERVAAGLHRGGDLAAVAADRR